MATKKKRKKTPAKGKRAVSSWGLGRAGGVAVELQPTKWQTTRPPIPAPPLLSFLQPPPPLQRAIKLARQAREIFGKTPKRFRKDLEEVNAWLQQRGVE